MNRLIFIMWRASRASVIAAVSSVLCVADVPLFAQSNNGARPAIALERSARGIARKYVHADFVRSMPVELPRNLTVPQVLRPLVESMLRRSATFARQCGRIAHASQLTVVLELAAGRTSGHRRARTVIVRRGGRLTATVTIADRVSVVELIAHEIEHIIEQLDDIDLHAKAALRGSGVEALGGDGVVFETIRANRVGQRVAAEVRAAEIAPSFFR